MISQNDAQMEEASKAGNTTKEGGESYQSLSTVSMSRYVAFFAIILSLTVVGLFFPIVFLIPLLYVAVSFGFFVTIITALMFGLISYLLSFAGSGFVPLAFIEQPIIPILPRLLVGIVTYASNRLMLRLIKKRGKVRAILPKLVAAALGTITNTVFVILFMYLLLPNGFSYDKDTLMSFTPIMMASGVVELIVNIIVVPPLAISVNRYIRFTKFRQMQLPDLQEIAK